MDDYDLNTVGRKELQALAKSFGIKANQKSDILREKLREALNCTKENDGDGDEGLHRVEEGSDKHIQGSSAINSVVPDEERIVVEGNAQTQFESSCDSLDNSISKSSQMTSIPMKENTKADGDYDSNVAVAIIDSVEASYGEESHQKKDIDGDNLGLKIGRAHV